MNLLSPSLAILLSISVHTFAIAWILVAPSNPGADGTALDSITIEVVSTAIGESDVQKSIAAAGQQASPDRSAENAESPQDTAAVSPSSTTDEVQKSVDTPVPLRDEGEEQQKAASPDLNEAIQDKQQIADDKTPKADEQRVAIAPSQSASSVSSLPSPSAQVGGAAAREGAAAQFAMAVRRALAKTRPHHNRQRGRLEITFRLDNTGNVAALDVTRSSGLERLDAAATESVRKAKFPPPPARLSDRQLTFVVPFEFQ